MVKPHVTKVQNPPREALTSYREYLNCHIQRYLYYVGYIAKRLNVCQVIMCHSTQRWNFFVLVHFSSHFLRFSPAHFFFFYICIIWFYFTFCGLHFFSIRIHTHTHVDLLEGRVKESEGERRGKKERKKKSSKDIYYLFWSDLKDILGICCGKFYFFYYIT